MGIMANKVGLEEVRAAAARVAGSVHRTEVITCSTLDFMSGHKLFFKTEMLQKTGSFKARGALNAIRSCLERGASPPMIVTHSSGNHGQAVAWAAKQCSLPCTVVVPEGTPSVKCDAIKGYGAHLVLCHPSPTGRKETADKIARETGGKIVHPYDDYDVIAGQGTIGLELAEQVADLDVVLVPISGGGMTSGIAVAVKTLRPQCKVIAVEPEGKDLWKSLSAKERLWPNPPQFLKTIAEGIMTQQVGQVTFPLLCELVDGVITVSDKEMAEGCRLAAERMKVMVEAASGAAIAAALSDKLTEFTAGSARVGVILCGGNVDMKKLPWLDERVDNK